MTWFLLFRPVVLIMHYLVVNLPFVSAMLVNLKNTFIIILWNVLFGVIFFFRLLFSSNFGVKLVVSSKGKIVTAREMLADGPQPPPIIETIIITLLHLAFFSEKIELEVYCWLISFFFFFVLFS